MNDPSYGVTPRGAWPPPAGPPAGPQPPWPPPTSKPSRLPVILALAIALIAVAVAVGSWFRPVPANPPSDSTSRYSTQEVTDAKAAMCDAYTKAATSVAGAASRKSDDPTLQFSYVVNSRLAFHVANDYFRTQLEKNPATPSALATAFQNLISSYDDFLLAQLGDSPKDDIDSASEKTKAADEAVNEACK